MAKIRKRTASASFQRASKKTKAGATRVKARNANTTAQHEKFELGAVPKVLKGKKPAYMLLDGDILVYHCTTSGLVETRNNHDEYAWTLDGEACKEAIRERVDGLISWMKAKQHVIAFGGRDNFRKQFLKSYKAHRARRKPLGYFDMVEWVCEQWNGVRWPRCEADDVLGWHATCPKINAKFTPVIVSDDKDMDTIPGLHMCLKKPVNEDRQGVYLVTEQEADANHLVQALSGDSGDGYHGLKGIGPVKARAILSQKSQPGWWEAVLAAYQEAGYDEAEAYTQAVCARILRHGEFDPLTGEFDLWNPTAKKPRRKAPRKKASNARAKAR